MVLGEAAGQDPKPGDRIWAHAAGWAAELGLGGAAEAVGLARTHIPEASRTQGKAGAEASVGELSPAGREAEAGA